MIKLLLISLISISALTNSVFISKPTDNILQDSWQDFKKTYGKSYHSIEEEHYRFKIFTQNFHIIEEHNQKFKNGEVTFDLGVNQFADMFNTEFVKIMNGFKGKNTSKFKGKPFVEPKNVRLPDEIDWRREGAVTPIKNQGNCGSCWAFSATGSLEGQHFLRKGGLISLSEQNLVDCSVTFDNNGCGGGWMDNAFQYVKSNKGIDTEKSYPYRGVDEPCYFNPKTIGADDEGFVDVQSDSEEQLQIAVATVGPISVAIDAGRESFQLYHSGIYYEPTCSSEALDHGVLAVGYGTDNDTGLDFWIVKNSWGDTWGDKGYIKMSRNRNNNCGIAAKASYPLVE